MWQRHHVLGHYVLLAWTMCFSSVCFCYHGYSVLPWSTLYRVNAKWSYLLLYSIALRTALLSSFNMHMTKFNSSRGNVCISLHLLDIYIRYPLLPGTKPTRLFKVLGALWRLLYRVDNLPSIFLSSMSRKRLLDNQGIRWSLYNHDKLWVYTVLNFCFNVLN